MSDRALAGRARLRWGVVALGTVIFGLAGYFGFIAFVEGGVLAGTESGVMGLAAVTGFAAFFSPCSFPLLLTLLARRGVSGPGRSLLRSTAAVAAGSIVFFALLGIGVAGIGIAVGSFFGFDSGIARGLRLVVGALLVTLGAAQTGKLRIRSRVFDAVARRAGGLLTADGDQSARADFAYGFSYVLVGFG